MSPSDLAPDRRERVVQEVRERGTVRVRDLSDKLGVSLMTVRRDIEQLAREGLIERVHGGARVRGGRVAAEPSPEEKLLRNAAAKREIAALAASQIEPGEVVGIGAGTTTLAFARALIGVPDLTVMTNSVPVAEEFWRASDARVILSGGESTRSRALVGPIALGSLERLHLDVVVLGAHGVDIDAGCTSPNLLEAQVNQQLLERASRSMVLADAEKWGVVGLTTFVDMDSLDALVSDAALPERARSALAESGVDVLVSER